MSEAVAITCQAEQASEERVGQSWPNSLGKLLECLFHSLSESQALKIEYACLANLFVYV